MSTSAMMSSDWVGGGERVRRRVVIGDEVSGRFQDLLLHCWNGVSTWIRIDLVEMFY
jgi:hypothetical protein